VSLKRFRCRDCRAVLLLAGGNDSTRCPSCFAKDCLSRRPHRVGQFKRGAIQAHNAVGAAIRRGELTHPSKLPCADCRGAAVEYDHRDYNRPLEVEPVCRRCNLRRGPAVPVEAAA